MVATYVYHKISVRYGRRRRRTRRKARRETNKDALTIFGHRDNLFNNKGKYLQIIKGSGTMERSSILFLFIFFFLR